MIERVTKRHDRSPRSRAATPRRLGRVPRFQDRLDESDWPPALLLDEIWLRIRRVTVHALEDTELWPRATAHVPFMEEQLALGRDLSGGLLRPIVGGEDYAFLVGESAFGASNERVRSRLPYVLAFGFEIGQGLARCYCSRPEQVAAAGRVCAVFNLGIALFDLTHDSCPDLSVELTRVFGEASLRQLFDMRRSDRFCQSPSDLTEVGILVKLIRWFFEELHSLAGAAETQERDTFRSVHGLLLRSYRAEIRSATAQPTGRRAQMRLARQKSTLPFAVMSQVAGHATATWGNASSIGRIVELLGRVFWLIDDLADVVRDFQNSALNAVLARAAPPTALPNDEAAVRVLVALLEGDHIERTVDELVANLRSVAVSIPDDAGPERVPRLALAARSYTRAWLESL